MSRFLCFMLACLGLYTLMPSAIDNQWSGADVMVGLLLLVILYCVASTDTVRYYVPVDRYLPGCWGTYGYPIRSNVYASGNRSVTYATAPSQYTSVAFGGTESR